ncbi:MAG: DUF507 family protein [Candidatus Rokuibacteriota bacterium]
MRRREEIAARVSDAIVKRLVTRRYLDVKDQARVRTVVQRLLVENLQAEDQLDADARQLLQSYARDIRDKGLDYRQLLNKTKEKLARDRGFVL